MFLEILNKAIPIKTHLQNAILNSLTQEELIDIRDSNINENVIEKLILLARPYYEDTPTEETLYVLALSIGTIIKEYEWGTYYISKDGMLDLQNRIKNCNSSKPNEYSICIDLLNGNNYPTGELVKFDSSDHIRYANGIDVSGHNYGCNRQIEIQKNIDENEGYTVTIYNMDGIHPMWGNNVQMAPKQMRIVSVRGNIVSLRGFGYDMMGSSFSDYAIDLFFNGTEIEKATLKLLDRNVELEYFK